MYYFAHDFFEIGCKGTKKRTHSQTNCTKTDKTCTHLPFCATFRLSDSRLVEVSPMKVNSVCLLSKFSEFTHQIQ